MGATFVLLQLGGWGIAGVIIVILAIRAYRKRSQETFEDRSN